MSSSALAAVVVTYHPTPEMLARIAAYSKFLGHVVAVDNTEREIADGSAVVSQPGVTFLPMGGNRGLGDALNVGVRHAEGLGFRWIVLLDQDSVLTSRALAMASAGMEEDVGIVALHQAIRRDDLLHKGRTATSGPQHGCIDVPVTMTSGSILNARAFHHCGPFDAKLFIDYVDHDYCLRLRRAGFRIVQCLDAALDHELGEPKTVRFAGHAVSFITHRPFRSYYIVRNGLYVAGRYFFYDPKTAFGVIKVLCKELVKAAALETDKLTRLRCMALGLWHWMIHRYGKVVAP
jgi:rhamnosyltransferase